MENRPNKNDDKYFQDMDRIDSGMKKRKWTTRSQACFKSVPSLFVSIHSLYFIIKDESSFNSFIIKFSCFISLLRFASDLTEGFYQRQTELIGTETLANYFVFFLIFSQISCKLIFWGILTQWYRPFGVWIMLFR